MDLCSHSQTYDDFALGESICIKCGLVIETLLEPDSDPLDTSQKSESVCEAKQTIQQYLDHLNIENSSLIEEALRIFKYVQKRTLEKKGKRRSANIYYSYSIFEALNRFSIPRSVSEIARICCVAEKTILNLEKTLDLHHTYNPHENYVERLCDSLQLPFWIQRAVRLILTKSSSVNQCSPINTIIAIIIRLIRALHRCKNVILFNQNYGTEKSNFISMFTFLLNKARDEKRNMSPKFWNVRMLCRQTGANSSAIYRIMRVISEENVFSILKNHHFEINVHE